MTTTDARPTSRRGRKIAATALALVLVPAAAFAVWLLLKPVTGTIDVNGGDVTLSSATKTGGTASVCTFTTNGGTVHIDVGGFPGDTCKGDVTAEATAGSATLMLRSASWGGSHPGALTVTAGCAAPLDPGAPRVLSLLVTVPEDAKQGDSIAAGSGAGLGFGAYDEGYGSTAGACNL